MTRLSASQMEILRTRPQQTRLYLSIFQPQIIFQAQINDNTITRGARTINYDTVSTGMYTTIAEDMTMWIGTTPGAQDIGKIRVRSASSTQIIVSENSDIEWADNLYLTVFRYWELWPIFPRIISDPNNAENVIFYKDYDIAYTNQNTILGTFANAGPHRAALLDPASGQAQIYYSSTGSYNVRGDTLSYAWEFQGGTPSTSSQAVPGNVTYNTPGHYVTKLYISGSSGSIDTTYRYVSIYNESHPPIQKWQMSTLNGARDEGGHNVSFKVFEPIPLDEHSVVVLFSDDYYGNNHISLGGNQPNNSSIFWVGYIKKDSIHYDYEHSEVSFDATSITGIMKESSGFSVSVQSVLSPTTWYELYDMDSPRALYHYLRWHTTALRFVDFQFVGDLYKIQFFDSDRESMFDAVDNFIRNTLIGQVVSDRQGKIWIETQAMAYPNPTGSFPSVMDITNRDWRNEPVIDERLSDDISFMEYGGIAFSGVVTGTFDPLIGSAPGLAPGFRGSIDNHQGMALESQSQINRLVGNVFANKNSRFPTINLEMTENTGNLDIAPQETVNLNVLPSDTVRNVAIQGLYIPESISWDYDPENFILLPRIEFKQLVNGIAGETVTIPAIDTIGEGFQMPRLSSPPLPNFFNTVPNDAGDDAPPKVLIHDTLVGLLYSQDFNTPSPTWYPVNGGLSVANYQTIVRILICPNGAIWVANTNGDGSTDAFIARAPYVGGTFTVILDQAAISAALGTTGNGGRVGPLVCRPDRPEFVAFLLTTLSDCKIYRGNYPTLVETPGFTTDNANQGDLSYGGGKWRLTSGFAPNPRLRIFDQNLDALETVVPPSTLLAFLQHRHRPIGVTDGMIHYMGVTGTLSISQGNGASIINNVGSNYNADFNVQDSESTMAVSANGQFIMSTRNTTGKGKSADGGYTFLDISNLPFTGNNWRFNSVFGSQSKWLAVGSYVYYTNDWGSSNWIDKRGNLHSLNPIPALDNVRAIP